MCWSWRVKTHSYNKTMTLAAFLAFMEANGAFIFGLWVVIEQIIAANPKMKSNSTLQFVTNLIGKFLAKYNKKGTELPKAE